MGNGQINLGPSLLEESQRGMSLEGNQTFCPHTWLHFVTHWSVITCFGAMRGRKIEVQDLWQIRHYWSTVNKSSQNINHTKVRARSWGPSVPLHLTTAVVRRQDSQSSQSRIRRVPDDVFSGKLKWQRWEGVLPSGAVSIKNDYTNRIDYVCHFDCEAGFYTPSKGPYCYFPYADKELQSELFEFLDNEDNHEIFEWKDGSYGSVPENAVSTCKGVSNYVGKNRYGLGKVVPQFTAFFLPWEGYEYWYKYYQVLTLKKDAQIYHVSFATSH
ncbi:natterin-4-like [Myxocyprinus asiaticus]|uniref:natterin-4-like n=1 Tax=Myxocyprinus asiaticus TaxID=70543 RepID=UPI0022214317|nr:natterin-4-like [Myxocyprinus asiaticus]